MKDKFTVEARVKKDFRTRAQMVVKDLRSLKAAQAWEVEMIKEYPCTQILCIHPDGFQHLEYVGEWL